MKQFYTLILVSILGTSQVNAQKFKTALEFNEYMVSINDSLYKYGGEWGKEIGNAVTTKNFESLTPIRLKMESFILRKKNELRNMADYKGSKPFADAMVEFLRFESRMMLEAFAPFELMDTNTPDTELKTALEKLTTLAGMEGNKLNAVHIAQEDFGKLNGFTIQKAEN